MKQQIIIDKISRHSGNKPILDAPLIIIELPILINRLKNETNWFESDRNVIHIFKDRLMRILLIGLHKGARLKRHSAEGIVSLQVLEGNMVIETDKQSICLEQSQLLVLQEGILHSVRAREATIFLLTITNA